MKAFIHLVWIFTFTLFAVSVAVFKRWPKFMAMNLVMLIATVACTAMYGWKGLLIVAGSWALIQNIPVLLIRRQWKVADDEAMNDILTKLDQGGVL